MYVGQIANQQPVVQILPNFQEERRAILELRMDKGRETNKDNKLTPKPRYKSE